MSMELPLTVTVLKNSSNRSDETYIVLSLSSVFPFRIFSLVMSMTLSLPSKNASSELLNRTAFCM